MFGVVSFVIVGGGIHFPPEYVPIFPHLGLHFVHFLKQISGYTPLLYTVGRLNLQQIFAWYVDVNTTTWVAQLKIVN
jgi:hypothetical protein